MRNQNNLDERKLLELVPRRSTLKEWLKEALETEDKITQRKHEPSGRTDSHQEGQTQHQEKQT